MVRKLRVGPGGVAAELGLIDPRKAQRESASAADERQAAALPESDDGNDWIMRSMVLQPLPGRGKRRPGRVRWYHLVTTGGRPQRCWAFTTTRAVWELVRSGEPLSVAGTTYPDGRSPAPGTPIRCGSCGTHSVLAVELVFYEE